GGRRKPGVVGDDVSVHALGARHRVHTELQLVAWPNESSRGLCADVERLWIQCASLGVHSAVWQRGREGPVGLVERADVDPGEAEVVGDHRRGHVAEQVTVVEFERDPGAHHGLLFDAPDHTDEDGVLDVGHHHAPRWKEVDAYLFLVTRILHRYGLCWRFHELECKRAFFEHGAVE